MTPQMNFRLCCECLKLLGLSLIVLGYWWGSMSFALPVESPGFSDQYDRYFKKYSKRYFGPYFDWRWFKSQGIAESNLQVNAVSPVGAQGIMQIMPKTFLELKRKKPIFSTLNEPKWNIAAGVYYDRLLFRRWRKPLPSEERLLLAFSSYNAGFSRVLKGVKKSGIKDYSWADVKQFLPKETRGYVDRISELMDVIKRHRNNRLRGIARIRKVSY